MEFYFLKLFAPRKVERYFSNMGRGLRVFHFLTGFKTQIWLVVGIIAAPLSAAVEFLLSIQIANLLSVLGVTQEKLNFPFYTDHLPQTPVTYLGLFISLGLLRGVLNFTINQSAHFSHEAIAQRLRLIAFYENFGSEGSAVNSSSLVSKITEHFNRATVFTLNFVSLIPVLVQVVCFSMLLWKQSPILSAIACIAVCTLGIIVRILNRYVGKIAEQLPKAYETIIQRTMLMAKNWYFLRAIKLMKREHQKLIDMSLNFANQVLKVNTLANVSSVLPHTFGLTTVVLLILVETKNHVVSGVAFLAFLYLFFRVVQALSSLATSWSNLNVYYQSYKLVEDYVAQFSDEQLHQAVKPAIKISVIGSKPEKQVISIDRSRSATPPRVELVDVCFRYSPDSPWVLKNVNFTVEKGEIIGIRGKSGSGKSTLLALIVGVLKPTSGKILIDGLPPDHYYKTALPTFVGSEPYLIEGTVRENLIYGSEICLQDEQLKQCLERAQLHKELLDYYIPENGEGLSTGQKQRLMFARALSINPKLLLLDEPSANLDEISEANISDEIKKLTGGCTVIVVTHRPTLISWVKNVLNLNEPPMEPVALQQQSQAESTWVHQTQ